MQHSQPKTIQFSANIICIYPFRSLFTNTMYMKQRVNEKQIKGRYISIDNKWRKAVFSHKMKEAGQEIGLPNRLIRLFIPHLGTYF